MKDLDRWEWISAVFMTIGAPVLAVSAMVDAASHPTFLNICGALGWSAAFVIGVRIVLRRRGAPGRLRREE